MNSKHTKKLINRKLFHACAPIRPTWSHRRGDSVRDAKEPRNNCTQCGYHEYLMANWLFWGVAETSRNTKPVWARAESRSGGGERERSRSIMVIVDYENSSAARAAFVFPAPASFAECFFACTPPKKSEPNKAILIMNEEQTRFARIMIMKAEWKSQCELCAGCLSWIPAREQSEPPCQANRPTKWLFGRSQWALISNIALEISTLCARFRQISRVCRIRATQTNSVNSSIVLPRLSSKAEIAQCRNAPQTIMWRDIIARQCRGLFWAIVTLLRWPKRERENLTRLARLRFSFSSSLGRAIYDSGRRAKRTGEEHVGITVFCLRPPDQSTTAITSSSLPRLTRALCLAEDTAASSLDCRLLCFKRQKKNWAKRETKLFSARARCGLEGNTEARSHNVLKAQQTHQFINNKNETSTSPEPVCSPTGQQQKNQQEKISSTLLRLFVLWSAFCASIWLSKRASRARKSFFFFFRLSRYISSHAPRGRLLEVN